MNHNPKAFFLFNPEGHYANAMSIYSALKRSLDHKYYGNTKKSKNKINNLNLNDEPDKVSFKGTPFHYCEIPYDIFNVNRRTKLTMK